MNQAPEVDSNFICQHPNCGKKSCRLCKDVAHSPLHCNQVEKDEEVEKRAYIEGKMSEAMIRVCLQCKKPFVKQDGCNLIKCECGAKMCYLCRKPVTNYIIVYYHFSIIIVKVSYIMFSSFHTSPLCL